MCLVVNKFLKLRQKLFTAETRTAKFGDEAISEIRRRKTKKEKNISSKTEWLQTCGPPQSGS